MDRSEDKSYRPYLRTHVNTLPVPSDRTPTPGSQEVDYTFVGEGVESAARSQ